MIPVTIRLSEPDMNSLLGMLYASGDPVALRVWRDIQRQWKDQRHEQRRMEQHERDTYTPAWDAAP